MRFSGYCAQVPLGETCRPIIIYDHFLLIKLMNDRMNNLRRSAMNKLEEAQKKELKGKRFLLIRNEEDLDHDAEGELEKLRNEFADLGTASIMKECLRNIYKMAMDSTLARQAFELWCEKARASGIYCLKQAPKTITNRMEGILGYWRQGSLTNASQQGFNNKVGWLARQAYGYRDEEYLHLKNQHEGFSETLKREELGFCLIPACLRSLFKTQ
jgi:transposase